MAEQERGDVLASAAAGEGSWTGPGSYMGGAELGGTSTYVMQGEGAYEGLTAYVVLDEASGPISFSAIIFPGDMPVYEAGD